MVAPARDSSTAEAAPGPPTIGQRVQELVEFSSYYVAAQLDRFKLTAINIVMFAVLGAVAGIVGGAVVLTAGVLLVVGAAGGLGELMGHRFWLGALVASLVIIVVLLVGTVVVFKKVVGTSRGKLVAAYDQRKREQRETVGTDVLEQSRAA